MNRDLNPDELLSLLEAFTEHRTQAHLAAGNAWPLDQAELLLAFRDWISGLGPEKARSILRQGEAAHRLSVDEWLNRAKAPEASREESVGTLMRRITDALTEFRQGQPGSQAAVTLRYSFRSRGSEQESGEVIVELNMD